MTKGRTPSSHSSSHPRGECCMSPQAGSSFLPRPRSPMAAATMSPDSQPSAAPTPRSRASIAAVLVEFHRQGEVAILCRYGGQMTSIRLMHIAVPPDGYRWTDPPENNFVDTHVFEKLRMLNLPPSGLCTDEEFVRRLHLDICGVLPTVEETRVFLADSNPDKRARLVDRLLQRPEYADYWTKKWLDVLRVSRDSIQLAGSHRVPRLAAGTGGRRRAA